MNCVRNSIADVLDALSVRRAFHLIGTPPWLAISALLLAANPVGCFILLDLPTFVRLILGCGGR